MKAPKMQTGRVARAAFATGAAVALTAALAPAAFAETESADHDTAVKLYQESGQVTVVVATEIPAAIAADGRFVTAGNAKFENKGVAPLHVAKVGVKPSSSVNLVKKEAFETADQESSVWSTVAPGTGQSIDLADYGTAKAPIPMSQWNIKGGDELPISLAGGMKNPGNEFTAADSADTAPVAYTITWTVAYGTAE